MKSEQARMKSSPTASDEIKSASLNLAKQDFIACAYRLRYIASFVVTARRIANFIHECGFIPTQADLVEKDSRLYPILSLFLVRMRGLEPPRRGHKILSLTRLPVSPHPQICWAISRLLAVFQLIL